MLSLPRRRETALRISFSIFIILLSSLLPFLFVLRLDAAASTLRFHETRGVDVMKYTKDVMENQLSDAEIENLVETLKTLNIDHIALSIPLDRTEDYPETATPLPRTAEAFTQKWADTVHAEGLNIIWRGTFCGIEGIYNCAKRVGWNRFPAGTAESAPTDGQSTWLGRIYEYIVDNPGFFKDGDIWAPLPERTESIFQDSTSFLSHTGAGIRANYEKFFADLKEVSDKAFAKIGKSVKTGLSANNFSEVRSNWLEPTFFDTAGFVVIDYYGKTHTPSEMESDIRSAYASKRKPVFIQEWGDYWNQGKSQSERTKYIKEMYAVMQELIDEGILVGFNSWSGWMNSAEGLLVKDGSDFRLNYVGELLKEFFAANATAAESDPEPVPAKVPATDSSSSGSCPSARATGAFTACYYSGMDLDAFKFTRVDKKIDFSWSTRAPDSRLPADRFSASWAGNFEFSAGDHTFTVTADDGARLYIDNQLVIDEWNENKPGTFTYTKKSMSKGFHIVRLEYIEETGSAKVKLAWD